MIRFIILCGLVLLTACTAQTEVVPVGGLPDGVQIQLENNSPVAFTSVEFGYPDHLEIVSDLNVGETSEAVLFDRAYQSVQVTAVSADQTYTIEPLDLEGELENPITAGHYLLTLDIQNGHLLADLRPTQPEALDALIILLEEAGLSVRHEPSIQRGTPFDELVGEPISQREILYVAEQRLDIYLFTDRDLAAQLAEGIQPGGTQFVFEREDGSTTEQYWDGEIGNRPQWWLYDNFLLNFNGRDPNLSQSISTALDSQPLLQAVEAGVETAEAVNIRVTNMSRVAFDEVEVQFPQETVSYGSVPPGGTTAYQAVAEAYHYGSYTITAAGEIYELMAIDYVGETPLAPGYYTYVFEVAAGNLQQAALPDDNWPIPVDLINTDWAWQGATLADGHTLTPLTAGDGRVATIRFTDQTSPNEGEAGYLYEGHSGCNSLFGTYFVSEYQQLIVPWVGQTEMACEPEIMDSERFLNDHLQGISTYELVDDNQLNLQADGDTLHFERPASATD